MGKPSHFRVKDPKRCCGRCRYKKLNQKTFKRKCVLHNFILPDEISSLEVHTCDDFEPVEEGDS